MLLEWAPKHTFKASIRNSISMAAPKITNSNQQQRHSILKGKHDNIFCCAVDRTAVQWWQNGWCNGREKWTKWYVKWWRMQEAIAKPTSKQKKEIYISFSFTVSHCWMCFCIRHCPSEMNLKIDLPIFYSRAQFF